MLSSFLLDKWISNLCFDSYKLQKFFFMDQQHNKCTIFGYIHPIIFFMLPSKNCEELTINPLNLVTQANLQVE